MYVDFYIRQTFKQEGLNCHNFIIHISEDCRESKLQNEYVDLLTTCLAHNMSSIMLISSLCSCLFNKRFLAYYYWYFK